MGKTHWTGRGAIALALAALLIVPTPAVAQARADAPAPRTTSAAKRTAWTLIGAGLGFGTGMLLGLQKFDDAPYAERKIMTTALIGAAAGGLAGNVLSKDAQPSFAPRKLPAFDEAVVAPRVPTGGDALLRSRVAAANRRAFAVGSGAPSTPASAVSTAAVPVVVKRVKDDPLWEGMIAGAVIGAVVGGIIIPATSCNTKTNPECPVIVGLIVGIPLTAAGAALGALVDKLR